MNRLPVVLLAILALTGLNSCSDLAYYRQSITGHLRIIQSSRPIEDILSDPGQPAELKTRLATAMQIRAFARDTLQLPTGNSYLEYADTERRHVLWNVVAAPEFSLEPLKWCFPVVGCLSYRGYFSKDSADQYSSALVAQGLDVNISGVTAYSTLGWFDDPVMNTMLNYDDAFLAKVMFHELAHRLLYFKGDTEFNEAFADAIAEFGVRTWLQSIGRPAAIRDFESSLARQSDFLNLVTGYKDRLDTLYKSGVKADQMRAVKSGYFRQMQEDYLGLRQSWGGVGEYDTWFENNLNNAKLALVLTYRELVPGFNRLLEQYRGNLPTFFHLVESMEACDAGIRRAVLAGKIPIPEC